MAFLFLFLTFITSNSHAQIEKYTTIEPGVKIYSEYYPNAQSNFKGTIVFMNGSGMATEQWTQYNNFIVCAKKQGGLFFYDRNGLGKSPPDLNTSSSNPITAAMIAEKLVKLLEQIQAPQPYIVVGHSFGGLYADYFARRYPSLVKGVLLVDPVPQSLQYPEDFEKQQAKLTRGWKNISSRKLYEQHTYQDEKKSKFEIPSAEVFYTSLGIAKTRVQIRKLAQLPNNIPIIIISSSEMEAQKQMVGGWFEQQKRYLNKNPYSKAFIVDADHSIWIKKPEVVCEQIKKLSQST